ncbi:MAG: anti-sigma factor [Candidatus Paceibacterota bacterium]
MKTFWISITLVIIVVVGWFLFVKKPVTKETPQESATPMDNVIEEDELKDVIFVGAPSITLKDVANSGATGTAWVAVFGGRTYHRVIAHNMPELPGTDFYEGWMVKNPATGDFFSTGKMTYDSQTKTATIDFVTEGDRSEYSFIVITSEPDDGNPAPDKHIIEERFPSDTNFQVNI